MSAPVGSPYMVRLVLALISGFSFVKYGLELLLRARLKDEFARYGVPAFRSIVGVLEVLGGFAVLLGLTFPPLGAFGAAGLALLMILGLTVRIRIHDAPRLMIPAATFAAMNMALVILFLRG